MEFFIYLLAGCGIGFAVGVTGVGGGSLMTPLLLLFGFPLPTAVGTDLAYAAITKASGVLAHLRQRTIEWRIAGLMCVGSVPAAIATIAALRFLFDGPLEYTSILRPALGVMLILTACTLALRHWGQKPRAPGKAQDTAPSTTQRHTALLTVLLGAALGVLVTLSSVGAGAIAAALVVMLYPQLKAIRVIGTDLAHAVPLTLIGGAGHLLLGNVDLALLAALVAGSVPSIYLGTRVATRFPDRILQSVLATALLSIGVKFTFF